MSHEVIMPALGMAQDTGLLIAWLKEPGEKVAADDILFEVETDKSTAEVPAGFDGYLAAQLAVAGEEIPVGQTIAVVSPEPPENPVARSAGAGTVPADPPAPAPPESAKAAETPAARPATPQPAPRADGRILASPKARRLAMELGLDLARLEEAGYAQPYHAKDIDTLRALSTAEPAAPTRAEPGQITARVPAAGQDDFLRWLATDAGLALPAGVLWAAFAAAALREATDAKRRLVVELAPLHGPCRQFADPDRMRLSVLAATEAGGAPDLRLRDLTGSRISAMRLGAVVCPAISVAADGDVLTVTLDFSAAQIDEALALALLTGFAGRLEEPLRHLL